MQATKTKGARVFSQSGRWGTVQKRRGKYVWVKFDDGEIKRVCHTGMTLLNRFIVKPD